MSGVGACDDSVPAMFDILGMPVEDGLPGIAKKDRWMHFVAQARHVKRQSIGRKNDFCGAELANVAATVPYVDFGRRAPGR